MERKGDASHATDSAPEQVKSSTEVKDDSSKSEKWPFSEPQPIREDQVRNAVNFLSHPKVRGTPMVQRLSFLERKGLTREEIDEAFRRCPDPPTSEAVKTVASPEGKLVTAPPSQVPLPSSMPQAAQPSPPAQPLVVGPSPTVFPAHSGLHWPKLILGAGLIAAAGAGTGYFFQKVLASKLRAWVRDVVLDEKSPAESKGEAQRKSLKLSPLEEAVNAAAMAANAAATAVAEVANTSREVLKLQAEEWQNVRSLIQSLDTKTEELKSTLTIMSKNSQDAEGRMVSAHAEDPIGSNYYKRTYQRTTIPADQVQMKQGLPMSKSMPVGNGFDRPQSNGAFNNYSSQTEEDPWGRRKKIEVETFTLPKQHVESTVSEVEALLDQEIGSARSRAMEFGRGGPLGRQGWVPPPAPQTMMPGAASAIRYQKPATVNETRASTAVSEEKTMDLQTPFDLLQTGMPGSPSAVRLQHPVTIEGGKSSVLAEEKEMDAQTSFGSPTTPEVAEIVEITSVDKEIPSSSGNSNGGRAAFEAA